MSAVLAFLIAAAPGYVPDNTPVQTVDTLEKVCAVICGEWTGRIDSFNNQPFVLSVRYDREQGSVSGMQHWTQNGAAHAETFSITGEAGHLFATFSLDGHRPRRRALTSYEAGQMTLDRGADTQTFHLQEDGTLTEDLEGRIGDPPGTVGHTYDRVPGWTAARASSTDVLVACSGGDISQDTSEADLGVLLGPENVVAVTGFNAPPDRTDLMVADHDGGIGSISWTDHDHRHPGIVSFGGHDWSSRFSKEDYGWHAAGGVHVGLTVPALQKLNGQPFTLATDDGWDNGAITDWNGGKLARIDGACKITVDVTVQPKPGDPDCSGEGCKATRRSDDAFFSDHENNVAFVSVAFPKR